MNIKDMTRTAWKSGDVIDLEYWTGRWNARPRDTTARSRWTKHDTDRCRATIHEVNKDTIYLYNNDSGDWLELYDFQIESIEPIEMNAWR